MRTVFYIFGADVLRGTWVQILWMILAVITIFMGSMMAYKESLMKRRFAYSTVSQVSYILLGLSSMTVAGIIGGLLHILFHGIAKTVLFLMSGSVIYYSKKTRIKELDGIGKQMPGIMAGYTVASLALVGVPFTSAFVSKEYLAHGVMESGIKGLFWIGPAVLLISAVLTAGYLLFVSIDAFYPKNQKKGRWEKYQINWKMRFPICVLAAGSAVFGIWPETFIQIAAKIAEFLV